MACGKPKICRVGKLRYHAQKISYLCYVVELDIVLAWFANNEILMSVKFFLTIK